MKRKELMNKISNWYFSKNVLPYWVILLADTFLVFISAIFTFWLTHRTLITFEYRFAVLYSSILYAILSWVGARCFKTYAGVLRYSSTVDLLKLAYANSVSIALCLICTTVLKRSVLML